jgi:hypothetical protein
MSNRLFASVFVWITITSGWFWRVIGEHRTLPDSVRIPGCLLTGFFLVFWLRYQLNRSDGKSDESESD